MRRVFLDANVYFTGCASSSGASALVLRFARQGHIRIVASRLVLREAERNLRQKYSRSSVKEFHRFLQAVSMTVLPPPSEKVLARYEAAIHPKDVPVLAAAVEANVDYLVTLDRKHFFTNTVRAVAKGVRVLTPGDLLKELVRHPEQAKRD